MTFTTTSSPYLPMTQDSAGDYDNTSEGDDGEENEYDEYTEGQNSDNYSYNSKFVLDKLSRHRRKLSWKITG